MNIQTKGSFFLFATFLFIIHSNSITYAQKNFLLSNNDMKEFKLIREINTFWPTNTDSLNDVIEQKWSKSGNDEYYISYSKFDNEQDALRGTSYNANSYQMPFIFGSPTGEILGNASWVSIDGSAICFQKGNLGVKIFKPLNPKIDDPVNIMDISKKILLKIEEDTLLKFKTQILPFQISNLEFREVTSKINDLLIRIGYTVYKKDEITKWLIAKNSQISGCREQWAKPHSIFSIDISHLSDSIDAQKATEYRGEISLCPVFILNDYLSAHNAFGEWQRKWEGLKPLKYISLVGREGRTAIHLYYYNNEGIDFGMIDEIIGLINLTESKK